MLPEPKRKIPIIRLGEILLKIQDNESIDQIISKLPPIELKELRDFLEEEIMYISSLKDELPIQLPDIRAKFQPVQSYYYQQDCREPLESCLNESCFTSNPVCFSRKIKSQVDILIDMLKPSLAKSNADEEKPGETVQ